MIPSYSSHDDESIKPIFVYQLTESYIELALGRAEN